MSLLFDLSGFEALFQLHYRALCATAYRIVQDKEIAEDIVQDVFHSLWEKRGSLQIDISLKAYLIRSTINRSINYNKKYSNTLSRELHFGMETSIDANTTEQALDFKETSGKVESAIKALPPACRSVFVLSRYEHLSYKEISRELDISVKTVENQMTKALKHLRQWLLLTIMIVFSSFL